MQNLRMIHDPSYLVFGFKATLEPITTQRKNGAVNIPLAITALYHEVCHAIAFAVVEESAEYILAGAE